MGDEVGGRHQAREDKGHGPGEEAEHQEGAAHQFENAGDPEDRADRRVHLRHGEPEDLLRAVGEENERGDEAQHGEHPGRVGIEKTG